jgi:hypothetical protein
VLGLVEHFDESLEMYEAVFGLPFPDAMLHKSQAQADHQMHRHSGEDMDRRKQVQEELLAQFTTNPELDQLISIDLDLYVVFPPHLRIYRCRVANRIIQIYALLNTNVVGLEQI